MFYITALSIAGSDCSGGAGVEADIKTMSALGVYAASAITAITVQDTCGVKAVEAVSPDVVTAQIRTVITDIQPSAIKVGMVNDSDTINAIADGLRGFGYIDVVIDPIMVSSTGTCLMDPDALDCFCKRLLPLATLITPNVPEAEILSGMKIISVDDMRAAAVKIGQMGCRYVLIKGGHLSGDIKYDYLLRVDNGIERIYSEKTVSTHNTHGTGCTLSSAIVSFLARRLDMWKSVSEAKKYVSKALAEGGDVFIGKGIGPVNHLFAPVPLVKCESQCMGKIRTVQFITHSNDRFSYAEGAEKALEGGCRWIQIRMKDATDDEVTAVYNRLRPSCNASGAVLILDDRVHLVKSLNADGVHLGKNDMTVIEARKLLGPDYIIGATANTFDDIEAHYRDGADYIGCGPFRFTTTKKKLSPVLGLDGYKNIIDKMNVAGIKIPLVAIGGIVYDDIPQLISVGIDGVAVSGAILNSENPAAEMRKWMNL